MNATGRSVEDVTWWSYVQRHSDHAPNTHIAKAVGITPSSVGRWDKGSGPDPAQAAKFARAYGRPVLEAFVAAGFLTSEEARERPSAPPSLATLSDDDLIEEVRRRMLGGQRDGRTPDAEKSDDGPIAVTTRDKTVLSARRAPSEGKLMKAEVDRLGEESQDDGEWHEA